MEFCLDTNIIIEMLKDENSVASQFIKRSINKVALYTTSITAYELYFGPKYGGYESELEDIDSLFIWIKVLPFDKNSAKIAADIDAMLHKKGKPIGLRDVFIAAISITNEIPLVTRNIKHFKTISKETKYKLEVSTPEEIIKKLENNLNKLGD